MEWLFDVRSLSIYFNSRIISSLLEYNDSFQPYSYSVCNTSFTSYYITITIWHAFFSSISDDAIIVTSNIPFFFLYLVLHHHYSYTTLFYIGWKCVSPQASIYMTTQNQCCKNFFRNETSSIITIITHIHFLKYGYNFILQNRYLDDNF